MRVRHGPATVTPFFFSRKRGPLNKGLKSHCPALFLKGLDGKVVKPGRGSQETWLSTLKITPFEGEEVKRWEAKEIW